MTNNPFSRCSLWRCAVVMLCSTSGLVAAAPLYSAPVKLDWNPSTDASVQGYVVYYGLTNTPATNRIVVGTNLTVTVTNMLAGKTYRLYAVSYNALNVESTPSNQLLIAPAAIASTKLTAQTNRSMKLESRAAAGTVCGIQFSATMLPGSWRTLTNISADAAGNIIANDASASRAPKRFYRVALSAQPLISAMQIKALTNGNVQLSCGVPPDAVCCIQYRAKPNTGTWTTLTNITANAEGDVVVIDTTARLASSRFYRATFP